MDVYTEWTLKRSDLSATEKTTMILLLDFADEDYKVDFPEFKAWCRNKNFNNKTSFKWLQQAVLSLEKKGYLTAEWEGDKNKKAALYVRYEEKNEEDRVKNERARLLAEAIREREWELSKARIEHYQKLKQWEKENEERLKKLKQQRYAWNQYRKKKTERLASVSEDKAGEAGSVRGKA